jgi:hypothetical protein
VLKIYICQIFQVYCIEKTLLDQLLDGQFILFVSFLALAVLFLDWLCLTLAVLPLHSFRLHLNALKPNVLALELR